MAPLLALTTTFFLSTSPYFLHLFIRGKELAFQLDWGTFDKSLQLVHHDHFGSDCTA